MPRSTVAIVVAAGEGKRMATTREKQYLPLAGVPVLLHTLRVFEKSESIDGIIVVVGSEQERMWQDLISDRGELSKILAVVHGGKERQDSVVQGLQAVPPECQIVVIHDGVRPLITPDLLAEVVESGWQYGAAVAAVPVQDTVKEVSAGMVARTLERSSVWLAQTPQAFAAALIRRAHREAGRRAVRATDDAALVERLGVPVHIVHGSVENIKITRPIDLALAEAILAARNKPCAAAGSVDP
ncbi:MAG: 2-C-methyl-D-erythritol 4-phosphate cytidylyltransferase [Deltaproteobacteria bacterium]|nr:2-C-methyl-D-erythritol 4-phosphate cytidylyltransferase [Deltaproteobacteria bacterium]MBW2071119.1 2-C-methyl-D-erythritol 4-phosphate cytidylyltransferase [Deltaproteobacteria bacterium]